MGAFDSLQTFERRNTGIAKSAKHSVMPDHPPGADGAGREKNRRRHAALPQDRERMKVVIAVAVVERDNDGVIGDVVAIQPLHRFLEGTRRTVLA
jgi:hypothetical protein